jgi:RNA polymerase sigma-70 factor (ECF subfamily)
MVAVVMAAVATGAAAISLRLLRVSDEQLGSRLASGEAAAFDELYRRYVNRLAAYGSHLLGDGSAGDDVAQTTLLKAYTVLRAGRAPERVRPWLYRIAHNVAVDMVARRHELPSAALPEAPSRQSGTSAGALVAALAALPERQRRVYVLRELHGLRIDETAAELGLAAPQVEQALFAARNRLAEHLVFGDRLDCVTVRRLAAGPLAADERRALKSHLRSCPDCRATAGLRTRVLSVLPVVSVTWLRGLLTGIGAGGAPAAAKLTAVAASAGLAVGLPASVEVSDPGSKPLHLVVVPTKPATPLARHTVGHVRAPSRVHVVLPTAAPAPMVATVRIDERHATHRSGGSSTAGTADHRGSGETTTPATRVGGSEGPGGGGPTTTTISSLPPVTVTSGVTVTSSHEGPGDGTVTSPTVTSPTVTSPTVTSSDGHDGGSGGRDGGSDGGLSGGSGGGVSGSDGH